MLIGIRDLKADSSRVLAPARKGQIMEVTSHRGPGARIVRAPPQADGGLRRLMAEGAGGAWMIVFCDTSARGFA